MMITVFTPAYNRAYSLPCVFESLQRQTFRDFEWVVVDDGSTDDTADVCASFARESTFPMHYFRQQNSGKHAAINLGANVAGGEWFLILDSDDRLPERGLEVSARYIGQIADDESFAGVAGLRGTDEDHLLWIRGTSPEDLTKAGRAALGREYVDATSSEYRYRLRIPGDRAEVVRTYLMQSHPFPVFEGERFLSEGCLWQALSDEGYRFRWFNEITYCGDYLDDGLSKNAGSAYANSPRGTAYQKNQILGSKVPLSRKLREAVSYIRYGRAAGMSVGHLFYTCKKKSLFLPALPLALAHSVEGDQGVSIES